MVPPPQPGLREVFVTYISNNMVEQAAEEKKAEEKDLNEQLSLSGKEIAKYVFTDLTK